MPELRLLLLAHTVSLLAPKISRENILSVVEVLNDKLALPPEGEKERVATGRDITAGRIDGQRCRVLGTVLSVTQASCFFDDTTTPRTKREYVEVEIMDVRGDIIPTLPVVERALAETLLAASRRAVPLLVRGTNLELPELTTKTSNFGINGVRRSGHLLIEGISETYTHLDAIAATDEEKAKGENQLTHANGRVRDLLTSILIEKMGIVRGGHLDQLLEKVVVQSVGTGTIGFTPGTIHLQVVGPPGHGKKLLGEAAAILNPVFVEVMPGRTTMAGLTGVANNQGSPGAVTRASRGVLNIQDAHAYPEREMKALAPVLQHVMEDGEVRIGGMAGGQTRIAQTSLLIDTNRTTSLRGDGESPPIMNQLPLTSRYDFIDEIEVDVASSWKSGADILKSPAVAASSTKDPSWKRQLQVVVAILRDRHPVIDLSEVEETLGQGFQNLADDFSDFFLAHPLVAASLARRMAVSIKKVTSAAARSQDRTLAKEADANFALEAARQKLTFIRNHIVHLSACPATGPDPSSWISGKTGELKPSTLCEEYEKETGHKVSERTFRRHLQKLGAKQAGKGLYRLVDLSSGEEA